VKNHYAAAQAKVEKAKELREAARLKPHEQILINQKLREHVDQHMKEARKDMAEHKDLTNLQESLSRSIQAHTKVEVSRRRLSFDSDPPRSTTSVGGAHADVRVSRSDESLGMHSRIKYHALRIRMDGAPDGSDGGGVDGGDGDGGDGDGDQHRDRPALKGLWPSSLEMAKSKAATHLLSKRMDEPLTSPNGTASSRRNNRRGVPSRHTKVVDFTHHRSHRSHRGEHRCRSSKCSKLYKDHDRDRRGGSRHSHNYYEAEGRGRGKRGGGGGDRSTLSAASAAAAAATAAAVAAKASRPPRFKKLSLHDDAEDEDDPVEMTKNRGLRGCANFFASTPITFDQAIRPGSWTQSIEIRKNIAVEFSRQGLPSCVCVRSHLH